MNKQMMGVSVLLATCSVPESIPKKSLEWEIISLSSARLSCPSKFTSLGS